MTLEVSRFVHCCSYTTSVAAVHKFTFYFSQRCTCLSRLALLFPILVNFTVTASFITYQINQFCFSTLWTRFTVQTSLNMKMVMTTQVVSHVTHGYLTNFAIFV